MTKIETIGDAFWCAVGVEKPANHADAARLAYMALRMQSLLRDAGVCVCACVCRVCECAVGV